MDVQQGTYIYDTSVIASYVTCYLLQVPFEDEMSVGTKPCTECSHVPAVLECWQLVL